MNKDTDIDAKINLQSPLPKYYQLKEIIRNMIDQNELRPGEVVPPERLLCEKYGVSRMTARQAVMELVNEGLLYREQGRGTFVAEVKIRQDTGLLTSFTDDMKLRGMQSSSKVLSVERETAGPVVARMLQIDPTDLIVRVSRVRYADGKPMALETSHVLEKVASDIIDVDLSDRSLYEELVRSGVRISFAEQSYEAVQVRESEASLLEVPSGSPALLIERVTYDETDQPFEFVKSLYRGDRYRLTTKLTN